LIATLDTVHIPVIASGGLRNGLQAAKSLALGASMVGIALPLLKPAMQSSDAVKKYLQNFIQELKVAMFAVGAKNLADLRKKPVLVTGKTAQWLELRNIDVEKFAKR
ncbi:MAG: alpha-hydroxy-acid oxidizing protein, partial [Candidatus Aenigmatarchaeota archaeon]